jgi:hypothetical protein
MGHILWYYLVYMDKWFILVLTLILTTSIVITVARRQGIKDIEKTKTHPSSDDFEILED